MVPFEHEKIDNDGEVTDQKKTVFLMMSQEFEYLLFVHCFQQTPKSSDMIFIYLVGVPDFE